MASNQLRVSALTGGSCRLWGARESKQSAVDQRFNGHESGGTTFPVRGGRSQIREGMMERCREVRDEIATSPYGHLAMTWIQVGQLIARSPKLSVNNSF